MVYLICMISRVLGKKEQTPDLKFRQHLCRPDSAFQNTHRVKVGVCAFLRLLIRSPYHIIAPQWIHEYVG
ncbi:unnamed protein product [Brassica oleracea]